MDTRTAPPDRPKEIAQTLEALADRLRKGWPIHSTLEELQDALDEWVHDWVEADA
jgi:hypothetical protein